MKRDIFGQVVDPQKGFHLKRNDAVDHAESTLFFAENTGKQVAMHGSREFLGSQVTKRQSRWFFAALCVAMLFLVARSAELQLVRGAEFADAAIGISQRIVPIPSERGLMYDRNGIQLTKNIPNFSLALVRQDLPRRPRGSDTNPELEAMIFRLAEITDKHPDFIRDSIERYGTYGFESIVIEEDIDYETALEIQIEAADLPGIAIKRGSKRLYLPITSSTLRQEQAQEASSTTIAYTLPTSTPSTLAHILGYQSKLSPEELPILRTQGYLPTDVIGKTGLEKQYETDLRGTYGRRLIQVNVRGKEQQVLSEEAPTPGKNLVLTIDAEMQSAIEDILRAAMEPEGKTRAAAVALDPRSGEVLALVSMPGFDNNDFSGGIDVETYQRYITDTDRPLFHRAIGGRYPSGSTIKPAIAAAALQEKIITPNTTFGSYGGLQVGPWFFPDWLAGGHGRTDVRKSIADSVNTFYYYIGGGYEDFTGLGVDRITAYLKTFGFSEVLGIDMPGEQAGFLPSRAWKEETKGERWYVGDTYNLSIGQGDLLATPLQIAHMTAIIAERGVGYQPHLVKEIVDPVTKELTKTSAVQIHEPEIDTEWFDVVRAGMRDCVTGGSCARLSLLKELEAAGKTGTAQWNRNKDNHAWFTSFAPYDNPEIVFTVLVEEGGGGSAMAAPIAHQFYKWVEEREG
jgi:penicillin-binding protein 2